MAGSPWEHSPYPPFPVQYPPTAPGPSFDPRRRQYGQPPPAGFYNPAVFAQQPGATADYRAYAPPPMMPQPQIPSALTPGAGHRMPSYPSLRSNSSDLPDLFFTATSSFPTPQVSQMLPYPSAPQIRQTVSAPAPPVPKKPDFTQPPLPPKPTRTSPPGTLPMSAASRYPERTSSATEGPSRPMYPERTSSVNTSQGRPRPIYPERISSANTSQGPHRPTYPDLPQSPGSPLPIEEGDQAFRLALEQSARDTAAARQREEEELARAMAESLSMSSLPGDTFNQPIASSSRMPHSAPPTMNASPVVSPPVPSRTLVQPPESQQSNFGQAATRHMSTSQSASQQILDDEALARRLAEEDAGIAVAQTHEPQRGAQPPISVQTNPVQPPLPLPPPPPEYSPSAPASSPGAAPSSPAASSLSPAMSLRSHSRQPSPMRESSPPPEVHVSRRSSANALPQSSPAMHEYDGRTGRSQSFGASSTAPSLAPRPSLPHSNSTTALRSSGPSSQLPTVPERFSSQPSNENSNPERSPSGSPASPPSPVASSTSQYVDNELLRGVTIGFGPPTISAILSPFEGPIPNVIALPYGRAPPLHIKAPDWRGMLKLMARLSNTRLEPTLEAMAVVKTAMHLRVIVNFVKVHQSSNDWHVILYMTIDHPVPEGHRYKERSTNDPALLPYSYTLSPTPVFLRESADGPLSKWYSVPASAQNPYPALPMSFPDLATYLMNALEDSRRAISDRSSGNGRLAKAVDLLYPNQRGADDEPEERRGLTDRVRGLFGRGNRANRPANDDRSALVTPFFADDFGR